MVGFGLVHKTGPTAATRRPKTLFRLQQGSKHDFTHTKPKYLVQAERGARGKKPHHMWQESESTTPANGALSPSQHYSQHWEVMSI
jgi:hypothetical protein